MFPACNIAVFDEEPSVIHDHQPGEDELGPRAETKTNDHGRFQFPTSHPSMPPQPPYAKDDRCEAVDSLTLVNREIAATPQPLRTHRRDNCF